MKILLDENIPHELRTHLAPHDVYTVTFMKWNGVRNGNLLKLAQSHGFGVLITTDKGFQHEQNTSTLPVAVVIIMAKKNTMGQLSQFIPQLVTLFSNPIDAKVYLMKK